MSTSRERRWWGVPRSFAGFSLWRLSNPFDPGEQDEARQDTSVSREPEGSEPPPQQPESSPARSVERSPSRRRDRSRSRSSSFSFKSRKSVDRVTIQEEPVEVMKKNVLPDISFTFFAEKDREDECVVIDPCLRTCSDIGNDSFNSSLNRTSEIKCVLKNNLPDIECKSDRRLSEEDDRVKRVEEDPEEMDEVVRHVTSVVVTMRAADYDVLREPAYSSPATPVYATVNKQGSASDSTSSKDFVEALPYVAFTDKSSTLDSVSSKDLKEALPSVPLPDWDEISETSEYNADYAELASPVVTPAPVELEGLAGRRLKEVVHDMEYCQHRAELKPTHRRVTLLRCKKNGKRAPSMGKMKIKLGKAWKKVRGWWIEERIRLNEVMLKRESVRESSVDYMDGEACRSVSEEDVCARADREDVLSACSTLPVRRRRPPTPTPALSRSSSIAAFRRSRFFPESMATGQTDQEEVQVSDKSLAVGQAVQEQVMFPHAFPGGRTPLSLSSE